MNSRTKNISVLEWLRDVSNSFILVVKCSSWISESRKYSWSFLCVTSTHTSRRALTHSCNYKLSPDERCQASEVGTIYKKNPNMTETVWVHPAHTVVLWNGFMFKITDQLVSFLRWWPLTWGQSGVKGCSWTGSSAVMPKKTSYCSRIIASWKASIHLKTNTKDE